MNKNTVITVTIIAMVVLGAGLILYGSRDNTVVVVTPNPNTALVTYTNTEYGFTFSLPESWKGFSIVKGTWEGSPLMATATKQTGTKLLIRNPKWTSTLPYQDIPVMVFTVTQWNSYVAGNFSVSAAPIFARELGRNNLYLFALPPRWNFDYSEGYVEAESIVTSNPLTAFTIQNNVSGRLNTDAICEGALSYMSFPDGASANKFVSECKEGKHPEVIEKYQAEMIVSNGATI